MIILYVSFLGLVRDLNNLKSVSEAGVKDLDSKFVNFARSIDQLETRQTSHLDSLETLTAQMSLRRTEADDLKIKVASLAEIGEKQVFPPNLQNFKILKLPTEVHTSNLVLLTYWLTHWFTHSYVRIMLLKTWERWRNHTLDKLLQGFRQQVTWPTLLGGKNLGNPYKNCWLTTTTSLNPSTFLHWSLYKPGENLLLDEKKDSHKISNRG